MLIKRGKHSITLWLLRNLEYPSPKDVLCEVWLKLTSGSVEEFHHCIFAIWLLSPLGKRRDTLFEQTWIIFTFVPSLVEIGRVVLERKMFFNFVNEFSLFGYNMYLLLEKGVCGPSSEQTWIPPPPKKKPKNASCQGWLKLV